MGGAQDRKTIGWLISATDKQVFYGAVVAALLEQKNEGEKFVCMEILGLARTLNKLN